MASKVTKIVAPDTAELGGGIDKAVIGETTDRYEKYFDEKNGKPEEQKKRRLINYQDVVNTYYDLATSFYEYGWGESFHFASRLKTETLRESIYRHEHFLALKLGLKPEHKVLDVGCGVGGPLRSISAFSGAAVIGLNNNDYQIKRGRKHNQRSKRYEKCDFIKGDFMKIPVEPNTFDHAYQLEATCHAPDLRGCYAEIFRVLKPGAKFASCDWAMTEKYRDDDPVHKASKEGILLGNGLPDLLYTKDIVQALKDVGFEVLEAYDLSEKSDIPWYTPIDKDRSAWTLENFRTTWVGRGITHYMVSALETLRIAPKGTQKVSEFLVKGADALVEGGRREIFTPMFFTLAQKPLKSK